MNRYTKAALCAPFLITICAFASRNNYKNFHVATFLCISGAIAQTPSLATFEVAIVKLASRGVDPNSGYWSYPGGTRSRQIT
jgi:hypothetical protein